ncbi:MAG: IS110 family transposase [Flavonifractor plautii]
MTTRKLISFNRLICRGQSCEPPQTLCLRRQAFKILRKNCCGLTFTKPDICLYRYHGSNGRTEYKQARFSSFSNGLRDLADWLAKYSCSDVCMESTGKYWIPVFNILKRPVGSPWRTRNTKPQKGNKTDRKDAKWICDLYMRHGQAQLIRRTSASSVT